MTLAIEYQPLKTIRLYGVLGATFGRVHRLAVETRQEAIKALRVIIPGFEKFLLSSKSRGLAYAVFDGKRNLAHEELDFIVADDIRIAPVIIGSKQAGLFQTILGAVLVAVGYFTFGTTSTIGVGMMMGGASMALGGPVNSIAQGNPVPILYGRRRVGGAIISAGVYAEDQQ